MAKRIVLSYLLLSSLVTTHVAAIPATDVLPQPTNVPVAPAADIPFVISGKIDDNSDHDIEELLHQYPQARDTRFNRDAPNRPLGPGRKSGRAATVAPTNYLQVPNIVLNVPPKSIEQEANILRAIKKISGEEENNDVPNRAGGRRGTAYPETKEIKIKPKIPLTDDDEIQVRQPYLRKGGEGMRTLVDPKYGTMISPILPLTNGRGTGIFGKASDDSHLSVLSMHEYLKTPRRTPEIELEPAHEGDYYARKEQDIEEPLSSKNGLVSPPPRIPLEQVPDISMTGTNPYNLNRKACQEYLNTWFQHVTEYIQQTHNRMSVFEDVIRTGTWPGSDPPEAMGPGDLMLLLKEVMEYVPAINTYYNFLMACHEVPLDEADEYDMDVSSVWDKHPPPKVNRSKRMYLRLPSTSKFKNFSEYLGMLAEEMETFMKWLRRDIHIPDSVFQAEIAQWIADISPYPANWDEVWIEKLNENTATAIASVANVEKLLKKSSKDAAIVAETYIVYYVQRQVLNVCKQRLNWFTTALENMKQESLQVQQRSDGSVDAQPNKKKGVTCPKWLGKLCSAFSKLFYTPRPGPREQPRQLEVGDNAVPSPQGAQRRPDAPSPLDLESGQAGLTTSQYGSEIPEEYEEAEAGYEVSDSSEDLDDDDESGEEEAPPPESLVRANLLRHAGGTPGPRADGPAGFANPRFMRRLGSTGNEGTA